MDCHNGIAAMYTKYTMSSPEIGLHNFLNSETLRLLMCIVAK